MKNIKHIHIDSDKLDPVMSDMMNQDELNYYKFFNRAWNKGMYSGEFISKQEYNQIQKETRKERMSIHKRGHRVDLKQVPSPGLEYNIPVGAGDTLAPNFGLKYTIRYLAKQLSRNLDKDNIRTSVDTFIINVTRAVVEARRSQQRKQVNLIELTNVVKDNNKSNAANRYSNQMLKRLSTQEAIEELKYELVDILTKNEGEHTSKIMLISYGEIIASILRKYKRSKRR